MNSNDSFVADKEIHLWCDCEETMDIRHLNDKALTAISTSDDDNN